MQNQKKKALIIGCGIAGPALALFLKRADIDAEIYEARETLEGYSLSLSCNGVSVLKTLSLDGSVFAEGSAVTNSIISNGKGKRLGEVPLAEEAGIKSAFIKRVPLGAILSEEATRQGISITYGKKLERIEVTSESGVIATFQDGTSASGDLLIGADGVHSRTRQLIDSTFPSAVYTGLINSGGYTSSLKVSSPPETTHFIFGKRAFFGYHVSQTGYIYWFVNYVQEKEPAKATLEVTDDERKQHLLELFQDDQPLIRDIIGASEETFPYFLSYVLPKQPTSWHKGPVVLIGDAVHAISPSSGQGASMALEDAAILAQCLRDIPNIEQAFITYEQLRRERTAKVYELGVRQDSGKHTGSHPIQLWFRDLTTPLFLKLFANAKSLEWLYSYRINWDTKLTAHTSDANAINETANHVSATK